MRRFLQAQQWVQAAPPAAQLPFTFTYSIDGIPPDFAVEAFVINLQGGCVRSATAGAQPGQEVLPPECLSQLIQSVQYNATAQNGITIPNLSGRDADVLWLGRNQTRKGSVLQPADVAIDHDVVIPITPQVSPDLARNFRVFGNAINGTTMQVICNLAPFNDAGAGVVGEIDSINVAVRLGVLGQTQKQGLTYSPLTISTLSDIPGTTYSVSDQFLSAWYCDQRLDWQQLTLTTGVTDSQGAPTGERQTIYNQLTAREIDESDAKHALVPAVGNQTSFTAVGGFQKSFPIVAGNASIQNIPLMVGGAINAQPTAQAPWTPPVQIPGQPGFDYASIFDARASRRSSPPYNVQFNNKTAGLPYNMIFVGYRP